MPWQYAFTVFSDFPCRRRYSQNPSSILLLYYSLQLKDREIASLLGLSRSKIQKDRKLLFNELKKRMVE